MTQMNLAYVQISAIGLASDFIIEVEPTVTRTAFQVVNEWVNGQNPLMGKSMDPSDSETLERVYMFGPNVGLVSITTILSREDMKNLFTGYNFKTEQKHLSHKFND